MTAHILMQQWNTAPPGHAEWFPANHNADSFAKLAEILAPIFAARPTASPWPFALEVLSAFLAVRKLWGDKAPPKTPGHLGADKWLSRVQEAMAGRLEQQGPPTDGNGAPKPKGYQGMAPKGKNSTPGDG